jgi:hypothetical protein
MIRIEYISYVALAVSLLSLAFTGLTYYRNSAGHQLLLRQKEIMRAVASRTVILWDQYETVLRSVKHKTEIHPFVYSYIQATAKRLEDAIDEAIKLDLTVKLITKREYALLLHTTFCQTLHEVANAPKDHVRDTLLKQNFYFGLVRTLQQCGKHGEHKITGLLSEIPYSDDPELPRTYMISNSKNSA